MSPSIAGGREGEYCSRVRNMAHAWGFPGLDPADPGDGYSWDVLQRLVRNFVIQLGSVRGAPGVRRLFYEQYPEFQRGFSQQFGFVNFVELLRNVEGLHVCSGRDLLGQAVWPLVFVKVMGERPDDPDPLPTNLLWCPGYCPCTQ